MRDDAPADGAPHAGAVDVLIVGAGPTGLTLAAQLRAFGVRFRLVDRLLDRGHESRALAVQARSLEIFQSLGIGERLVARGRTSTRVMVHFEARRAEAELGEFGARDTRFPFILFVSQAETEALLRSELASHGVAVERGVELGAFHTAASGVHCTLRHHDGREEQVDTRFLVGCDGAHSTVRHGVGIPFEGGDYLQTFMLGDVEVEGPLERDVLHAFAGRRGFAMFFPLGSPTTWRVIALPSGNSGIPQDASMTSELPLPELQGMVDGATGGSLRLRDAAWLTRFRLHHRQTAHYRAGPVFLAGDAAHIHSPVGAQGMNTGIQDAWNLGWKLALVARAQADERLLDSYEAERWPVGHALLRTTDRVFSLFSRVMTSSVIAAWLRRQIASRILPRVLAFTRLREFAFRFISELAIRYRKSPAVTEGQPRLRSGPRAGDRCPDRRITRDGQPSFLQQELSGAGLHLLLCGTPDRWDDARVAALRARWAGLLMVHRLTRHVCDGALVDASGELLATLGVRDAAQYLVRPDGYIGFRCAGRDLGGADRYLTRWFRPLSRGASHVD
ncbi:MAG TPA: FAD-dependent monooxygenase [Gemmatimonadaceae bacterium]|nr:FAD-dependent monooxygenase [Gemmatimonadaceae bacterium]